MRNALGALPRVGGARCIAHLSQGKVPEPEALAGAAPLWKALLAVAPECRLPPTRTANAFIGLHNSKVILNII